MQALVRRAVPAGTAMGPAAFWSSSLIDSDEHASACRQVSCARLPTLRSRMSHNPFPMTTRRAFVTGALAVTATARLTRATAATPLAIPEVDSLAIQVLVDNATFGPFLPDLNLPGLHVERIAG